VCQFDCFSPDIVTVLLPDNFKAALFMAVSTFGHYLETQKWRWFSELIVIDHVVVIPVESMIHIASAKCRCSSTTDKWKDILADGTATAAVMPSSDVLLAFFFGDSRLYVCHCLRFQSVDVCVRGTTLCSLWRDVWRRLVASVRTRRRRQLLPQLVHFSPRWCITNFLVDCRLTDEGL